MWLLVIWSLYNNSVIPSSTLLTLSHEECLSAASAINDQMIAMPRGTVGASCAFSELPRS
jgi:hypothetical protein